MSKKWKMLSIIGGAVLLLLIVVAAGYNNLVTQREKVRNSFANVQTQYQRRSDLVPNLVNTVKGAANFESDTLQKVTEQRAKVASTSIDISKATPAQIQQYASSQSGLDQALSRLLAVAEDYPQLTATQNYKDLQAQLEGTENRIAVARKDYNDVAAGYNAKVQRFPSSVLAGLFGFDKFTYFQADAGSDKAPTVDFGN
jgi:LemA protein